MWETRTLSVPSWVSWWLNYSLCQPTECIIGVRTLDRTTPNCEACRDSELACHLSCYCPTFRICHFHYWSHNAKGNRVFCGPPTDKRTGLVPGLYQCLVRGVRCNYKDLFEINMKLPADNVCILYVRFASGSGGSMSAGPVTGALAQFIMWFKNLFGLKEFLRQFHSNQEQWMEIFSMCLITLLNVWTTCA